jgi:hypothetical protein
MFLINKLHSFVYKIFEFKSIKNFIFTIPESMVAKIRIQPLYKGNNEYFAKYTTSKIF